MLNEIHRFMLPNEGSIHFEFSQIFFIIINMLSQVVYRSF